MSNQAAWYREEGKKLSVGEAELYKPAANEVLIRVHAAAVNPVDYKIQSAMRAGYVKKFPIVIGEDVAGIVDAAGAGVTRFKRGDRVAAQTNWLVNQDPRHGGFQLYTAVPSGLVCKIPDNLTLTQASVIPLAVTTAAAGLYEKTFLNLPLPKQSTASDNRIGALLIWGAASSVGTMTIQLARASGALMFATVSATNNQYAKDLGADHVFDYKAPDVEAQIVKAIKESGLQVLGAYDAIGNPETLHACARILQQLDGNKFIAATQTPPDDLPVKSGRIFAANIWSGQKSEEIGDYLFGEWLEGALADGRLKALPTAKVVGQGLEAVQPGLDELKAGNVHANKLVIELA